MDKPPEQGAKIIDLFSKRERPPKRLGAMGAKVVELSSIRSSRSDEAPDISPDHIQDAQIIEIPDMPSEIRQEVSELVNDTIKEFKGSPLGLGRKCGRRCVLSDRHSHRHPLVDSPGGAPFLAALSVMVGHADIPGLAHRGRVPGAVSKTLGAPRVDRERRGRAVVPVGIRFLPRSAFHADRYPYHSGDRSRRCASLRLHSRLVRPAIGWVRGDPPIRNLNADMASLSSERERYRVFDRRKACRGMRKRFVSVTMVVLSALFLLRQ